MKKQSGSGLIFAVVLLFVILGMVITLSSITVLETKMSQKTKSSVGAFYNSESGVEWALNKIATTTASNVIGAFPEFSGGKAPCPTSDCEVYLLDKDGIVITNNLATIEEVKAVRSVGTQNTGEVTQRAIEAAVAASGCQWYAFENINPSGADTYKCANIDDLKTRGATGACRYYSLSSPNNIRWGVVNSTSGYTCPNYSDGKCYIGCNSGSDGICGMGNAGPTIGGRNLKITDVAEYYACN